MDELIPDGVIRIKGNIIDRNKFDNYLSSFHYDSYCIDLVDLESCE